MDGQLGLQGVDPVPDGHQLGSLPGAETGLLASMIRSCRRQLYSVGLMMPRSLATATTLRSPASKSSARRGNSAGYRVLCMLPPIRTAPPISSIWSPRKPEQTSQSEVAAPHREAVSTKAVGTRLEWVAVTGWSTLMTNAQRMKTTIAGS